MSNFDEAFAREIVNNGIDEILDTSDQYRLRSFAIALWNAARKDYLKQTSIEDFSEAKKKFVDDGFRQMHFAVRYNDERTTIMLEQYLVNAIQHKTGLKNTSDVAHWINEIVIKGGYFDPDIGLTKQIKRLIIGLII